MLSGGILVSVIITGIIPVYRYTGIAQWESVITGMSCRMFAVPRLWLTGRSDYLFFLHVANHPAVESLLNDAPATSADPIEIQQPFAASTCYYIPKTAISPVWKVGFRCRSDQDYKKDGALVFCTNDKCKNSASLPVGHKHEFPVFRKWKSGDSNQIMLILCRREHKDEFDAGSKTQASVASSAILGSTRGGDSAASAFSVS